MKSQNLKASENVSVASPASIFFISHHQHPNFPLENYPHLSFEKAPAPGFSISLRNIQATLLGSVGNKKTFTGKEASLKKFSLNLFNFRERRRKTEREGEKH